jgi:hypothetical protein
MRWIMLLINHCYISYDCVLDTLFHRYVFTFLHSRWQRHCSDCHWIFDLCHHRRFFDSELTNGDCVSSPIWRASKCYTTSVATIRTTTPTITNASTTHGWIWRSLLKTSNKIMKLFLFVRFCDIMRFYLIILSVHYLVDVEISTIAVFLHSLVFILFSFFFIFISFYGLFHYMFSHTHACMIVPVIVWVVL